MNPYYAISTLGSRLLSLITILYLSYVLDPSEFGIFSLVSSNALLIHIVFTSWISNSLWRDASQLARGDEGEETLVGFKLVWLALALLFLVSAGMLAFLPSENRPASAAPTLAGLILLFESTAVVLNGKHHEKEHALLNFSRGLLSLCSAALLVGLGAGVDGAILSQLLAVTLPLVFLSSAREIRKGGWRAPIRWRDVPKKLKFGLVSAASIYLYMAGNVVCRNVIALRAGEAEAGYFALASDLFYGPLALFATAVSLSKVPSLFAGKGADDDKDYAEFLVINLAAIIPYAVGALFVAPSIAILILGPAAEQRVSEIAVSASIQACSFVTLSTLTTMCLTSKRTWKALAIAAIAILSIAGSLLVVEIAGLWDVYDRWIAGSLLLACSLCAAASLASRGLISALPELVKIGVAAGAMALILNLLSNTHLLLKPIAMTIAGAVVFVLVGHVLGSSSIKDLSQVRRNHS